MSSNDPLIDWADEALREHQRLAAQENQLAVRVGDPIAHLQAGVDQLQKYVDRGRLLGHAEVSVFLRQEASRLMDEAFRYRNLGQESVGKTCESIAKHLLSLISTLPSKLRAQ